jgi:hypothetical protein
MPKVMDTARDQWGQRSVGSGFEDIKSIFQANFSKSLRGQQVQADLAYVPTNGGRLN